MRKDARTKRLHPRIYKIWQGLRQRCNNPNCRDYPFYGGRGIAVCEEWNKSSAAFIEWALANGYEDSLSIDRIDVNGDYCPSNCRWATETQQAQNKRLPKNNKVGYKGIHLDRGQYRATIYANNKRVDLGRHKSLEEAIEARKRGEKELWGVTN